MSMPMDLGRTLILTIFLPLAGAILMWPLSVLGRSYVRWGALLIAVLTLVLAVVILSAYPAHGEVGDGFCVVDVPWLGVHSEWDVRFSVGLDGLGLWLFGLSALLLVTCVLVSWEAIDRNEPLFYAMLLLLECGCLGVFAARDIILFYVFFEFTLIPLFFLIGVWGSEQRQLAARKFFLFTLVGSVLTFLSLLAIVLWDYRHTAELTFSIPELTRSLQVNPLRPMGWQIAVFLGLFAGFAVKVPLFPLHTWLPLAHVQAPTAGSVFLAAILLKIGTYGFVRFNIAMLPEATVACMPLMLWLAVAGILYGAFVALVQRDVKRLVAYSSISHLGYCMLGLFALNRLGVQGGTLQMINHGISTGALFALVGMLYERYHTREIDKMSGLASRLPWLTFFMVVFTLSSIGLPGLNGFASEVMVLLGMFQLAWGENHRMSPHQLQVISVLAVSGVAIGAWYMLWMVQRVFYGPLREPATGVKARDVRDLSGREICALAPLAVLVVWIGVWPGFFLDRMAPTLNRITAGARRSLDDDDGQGRATLAGCGDAGVRWETEWDSSGGRPGT
ncbi:MAG: NADH-quinone oxidoreductase subunit M [Planctomycetes bacterium]|nr:NADH-quinone oxidoreductase subunit M [Planctomycetota bacterium]